MPIPACALPVTEVRLQLQPSRQLAGGVVITHLLATAAVWLSVLPRWVSLLITLAVLLHLWHWLQGHWLGLDNRELRYRGGEWSLSSESGEASLRPLGEWLVTSWLIVLRFTQADGRQLNLVLPPDSGPPEELRRLRVVLRFSLSPR